jgi:hypothetical protein
VLFHAGHANDINDKTLKVPRKLRLKSGVWNEFIFLLPGTLIALAITKQ